MEWASGGAERTFEQSAANGKKEPKAEATDLCCVRSQRGNCCNSVNFCAAVRRENRSFMRAVAGTTGPRIKLRDKPALCRCSSCSRSIYQCARIQWCGHYCHTARLEIIRHDWLILELFEVVQNVPNNTNRVVVSFAGGRFLGVTFDALTT